MDESLSLPNLWFLRYAYNPAFMIGTEYVISKKGTHDFHLTGNLGYYYHKDWQSTLFLSTEIGYRYHAKRWSFYPRLGVGYMHIFSPKPIYKFNEGEFRKVKDWGSPALMISLSLNASYKLKAQALSPELYFSFMESGQIAVNRYSAVHQLVGFGYKFYPFSKK